MLKYKSSDIQNLVDLFAEAKTKYNNNEDIYNVLVELQEYPVNVLKEFLNCMEILSDKDENYLRENYWGVIGYVTMRLNFC